MQHPISPTKVEMKPITSNPSKISGCFATIITLDFIASIAFKFPKMMRGMVSIVNNVMVTVIINPTNGICTKSINDESNVLKIEISNVALKSSLKYDIL